MKRLSMLVFLGLPLVVPAVAHAQTKKIEIGAGVVVSGASSAGTTRAELLDSGGNSVTLFEATHRLSAAVGIDAGLLYRLRPRVALEFSGSWTRPDLQTTTSDDFENVPDATITLGMHRFSVDASAVRHFSRRGAAEPYIRAGGGWFRELTTDRALVDDGVAAHAGGGLKYWLREGGAGWLGDMALRADVRVAMRHGGIELGDRRTRWSPVASVGVVIAR